MDSLKRIRRRQPTENTNGIGPHSWSGFHHARFNTFRTLSEQRKSYWNENTWMGTERKDIWQTKKKKEQTSQEHVGPGLGAADRVLCKHCFWQASEHKGQKLDTMRNISENKDLGWEKKGAGRTAAKCITLSAELSCIRVLMSSCRGFLSPGPLMAVVVQRAQQLAVLGLRERQTLVHKPPNGSSTFENAFGREMRPW